MELGAHRTLKGPFILHDLLGAIGQELHVASGCSGGDYTQRQCAVCHKTHPALIWLYQEEAGERRYICLDAYRHALRTTHMAAFV